MGIDRHVLDAVASHGEVEVREETLRTNVEVQVTSPARRNTAHERRSSGYEPREKKLCARGVQVQDIVPIHNLLSISPKQKENVKTACWGYTGLIT